MNTIEFLNNIISNIENNNYSYEYVNGGYHYSYEITDIFKVLELDEFRKMFYNNINNYSYDDKNKLEREKNPEEYSLIDCVIVLNWIWHVESGIGTGIIVSKLKNGSYLKTIVRFKSLLENMN